MRVNIDEIKEAGLDRSWEIPREALGAIVADDRAGWKAAGGAQVAVRLERLDRRVFVKAKGTADLAAECGRCLAPVTLKLPVTFELTLVPADEYQAHEREAAEDKGHHPVAGSFDLESAEEEQYQGKVIDLDPILREQVLLALPGYPVCAEGCKGLCPVCGKDMNEGDCGCDRRVPDPRWAGLAKLKLT